MLKKFSASQGAQMRTSPWIVLGLVVAMTQAAMPTASAATIPIGLGVFGPGSTLTTFTGLAEGTEVNGLTVDGILFAHSLGNGNVLIFSGGPGVTNNIVPQSVVSNGNSSGVLTLTLPSFIDTFGYGYALLATSTIANATTISLFSGATNVGSLSYAGTPDPTFAGGFAGIQSTVPFNRVQLTFNSFSASAFAIDNVRTAVVGTSPIPEPATLVLLGTGLLGVVRVRARRRSG